MRLHEEKGGPSWYGPPAGTNGPGRLDERRYDKNASFMTYPATESFNFSIGSANSPKCIKKPRQAHFECKTPTGGTDLHQRHFYVDPMETARRAEADRRADYDRRVEIARADYDRRVEMTRRDEYARRMEYDLSALCQIRKMSTAEDFELQARRLDEMGKIIDTLTTMLTTRKPPQPQGAAIANITCSQTQAYEECEDWSLQMTDKERGALNALVLMQEPGESIETTAEFSSPQVLALESGVACYTLREGYVHSTGYEREPVKTGFGFDRASVAELKVRPTVKCRRGTVYYREHRDSGKHLEEVNEDPGSHRGFHRAQDAELTVRKILKICRKTDEEGLVNTLPVADTLAHAPREATRGAGGWAAGQQRKEKAIQKRRRRKLSRIKRAGEYWKEESTIQATSGANNDKERHNNKEIRTLLARELRTSDPKLRTQKIIFSVKDPGMNGHRLGDVMSLRSYESTKREKMELITLVTKRASKKGQDKRDNAIRMIDKTEMKDWWKRLTTSKRNLKRQYRKGSTDVYLLKRTIELEID